MSDITHIKDLTPDPNNARRHNPRNIGMIERSLNEVGAGRSIVVDEDGVILAGNGLVEAAAQAGISRVRVVETDGNEIIAVRRRGLTAEQKTKLALFDNRTAELAEWEPDILAGIADSGVDLGALFYPDEWADVTMPALPEAGEDEPVTIDETKPTRCQPGETWRIGRHTVACLDSTDRANVERLVGGRKVAMVWSDPPYGMQFQSNYRTATPKFDHIKGDERPLTEFIPLIVGIPIWYICCRWDSAPLFMDAIVESGYAIVNWIVWHKSRGSMGDLEAAYRPTHETILYCSKERALFTVDGRDDDTWDIDTDAPAMYNHPTQKPIALPMRAIRNHTKPADLIFDPFLGSGPSLKAAEASGRTVVGCELLPHYCDHIIEWGEAHGLEVSRIDD
jgi:DNA modification methylase